MWGSARILSVNLLDKMNDQQYHLRKIISQECEKYIFQVQ